MKYWTLLVLIVAAGAGAAFGQAGQLSGRITDPSGETLPGATAAIAGTTLGAAADANGNYSIINVPPGTHSVRYSFVGYQSVVIEGLLVVSNQTTTQDVVLREEVIEGEEITITAERPIVDITLTSTMTTVTREQIAVLPVQELGDVVNLQAGVIDGHFRGGRLGEVQYQVDGVSVNNPFDNQSTLRLDRSVLQEVQVIQGTFDAEYGQAMSGVVNAVLRSGRKDMFEFNVETFMGDYYSIYQDRFPQVRSFDPAARQNYQLSLSGPLGILPQTSFLVSGQRYYDEGHMYAQRIFVPTDSVNFETGFLAPSGDSALVPLHWHKEWSWLGKISNTSLGNIKLDYQAVGNMIDRSRYNHAYRVNPGGTKNQRQFSLVHGLDWTHTVSDRMFYTISLRQNYFDYKDLKYDDVFDPRYLEAGRPQSLGSILDGANLNGVDLGRFIQRTNAFVSKGSVTMQATPVHLLKAGYEYQFSQLDFGPPGIITNVTRDGEEMLLPRVDTLNAQVLTYHPTQAALFVQDRLEWRELRVRAGLRMEYFDANSTIPSDLANPANSISGAPESHPQRTSNKLALAPRLGVSFPILDRASMFFSYGHFYQLPGLGQIFSNADYSILRDLQAGLEDEKGVLGNPDLKPEFTTLYEFGFKSAITPFLGLDVNLFYKDIRDLLGVEFVQTYTAARYGRFTNVDFGGVRGFTVSLEQRGPGHISSSIDYTLQIATGNSSDPKETFNRAAAGGDPRPRQIPFNWDQRHTLNSTVSWFQPGNLALTAIMRFGSGQPYTPTISSVFGSDLEPNSGRKASFLLVDLRAEKFFRFGGLEWTAFSRVFNLLDTHFVNGFIFADTGSPFYTLLPEARRAQLTDPSRFYPPRRIEIGFSLRGSVSR